MIPVDRIATFYGRRRDIINLDYQFLFKLMSRKIIKQNTVSETRRILVLPTSDFSIVESAKCR